MEIAWTKKAEEDYYQQIDLLLEHWNEATAEKFVNEVFETIDLIAKHPEMYARTDYPQVRKAVVNRHISLFYRQDEQQVLLLRFWPNRRDPDTLDI